MVEECQVVNPRTEIEQQPDNHDRCECACNFCGSKRLYSEEKNEDCASYPYNGCRADIWLRDTDTLNCTENRLRRSEDTITGSRQLEFGRRRMKVNCLMTIETPRTPNIFRPNLANLEFSMRVRTPLFTGFMSPVRCRSILTVPVTLGSRRTILA